MIIRPAQPKDIPAIAALSRRYTSEVPTWGQEALTEDQISRLDIRFIRVAEEGSKIAGYAIWQAMDKNDWCIFHKTDKVLRLDEIFVLPEARGQGLGSDLVESINEFAKREGFTKIFVYSAVKELMPVYRFYRGNGYQTWNIQMFKEL